MNDEAKLAWGARVSPEFRGKVRKIAANLATDPNFLMGAMAFESGRTFSPCIYNAAGSGAVGLIQFMPSTAEALGTSTDALAAMTAEAQLDYVEKYFSGRKGQLQTLEDVYMAVLWPKAIGKPNDYVLFDKADPLHPKRYIQNAGLDFNHDGRVTKDEAASAVRHTLEIGLQPENMA